MRDVLPGIGGHDAFLNAGARRKVRWDPAIEDDDGAGPSGLAGPSSGAGPGRAAHVDEAGPSSGAAPDVSGDAAPAAQLAAMGSDDEVSL